MIKHATSINTLHQVTYQKSFDPWNEIKCQIHLQDGTEKCKLEKKKKKRKKFLNKSPDTSFFGIKAGVLEGWHSCIFSLLSPMTIYWELPLTNIIIKVLLLSQSFLSRYPAKKLTDIDYVDDLANTADTMPQFSYIFQKMLPMMLDYINASNWIYRFHPARLNTNCLRWINKMSNLLYT